MRRLPVSERLRQTRRLVRDGGVAGLTDRLRRSAAEALAPAGHRPLEVPDERFAELARMADDPPPEPLPWHDGEPLTIAWVTVPPGPASGGHTTMFRLIGALEAAGHRCVVHLDDRHGWDLDRHRDTIRTWWPWVRAEVRDLTDGIVDAHAVVATGWGSAYAVRTSRSRGARCYLVQDFEPWFSAAGSTQMLAEATYRFGFHGITAGSWLAGKLRAEYGMAADHFDLGCDLDVYAPPVTERRAGEQPASRSGVAYYCRPETPRRAHELALVALRILAERRPDLPIHVFGTRLPRPGFDVVQHGELTPTALAELYRGCAAGLVLSATNVSLVPWEMLAAGCIPVVNDAPHNRAVLDNPYVAWADPTPHALAATLERVADLEPLAAAERSRKATDSVTSASWAEAGEKVEAVLRRVVAEEQTRR